MNILVFGCPRTGTNILQSQLCDIFNLTNLGEPFHDSHPHRVSNRSYTDPMNWAADQNNSVSKLLSTTLVFDNSFSLLELISAGKFDLIVVPIRKNLTDTCISLFYAMHKTKQFHYYKKTDQTHVPFECDMVFVKQWIQLHDKFMESLALLELNQTQYSAIDYDSYINNQEQDINGYKFNISTNSALWVNAEIAYTELCTNYQEVNEFLTSHVRPVSGIQN